MRQVITWITENSYKRWWIIAAAAVFVLLFGVYTFTKVKQELIPDIQLPIFTVIAQSPDSPPDELANGVTARIEDAASKLDGFTSSQSTVVDGLSVTLVNLDYGYSIAAAEQAMNDELSSMNLGPGVITSILKFDASIDPVIELSLEGDLEQAELTRIADEIIVPNLTAIDGVEAVEVVGGAVSEVTITVDRGRMLQSGLTLEEIAEALQANNVIIPSGSVPSGNSTVPLETVAIYRSLDDIRRTGIRTNSGGTVTLSDIATVEERQGVGTGRNRTNGQPAVGISIAKAKEANTVTVAGAVRSELDEIEATLPAGSSITIFQDQSEEVTESVNSVIEEGIIGGILAIIVVFIFLANWRTTIITAVSIPLSMIAAVIILDLFGYSLNLFTLGGLTIAIGRVIDDSVVVLENVYRHMVNGERGFAAIMNGAREVTIAILGATATTCAVFLPLGFVGGLIGQLFLPFAIAVVAALIASLVISITIIPVLTRFALVGHVKVQEERKPRDTFMGRIYAPLLAFALANRWKTLAAAGVLFIASLTLVPLLPVAFLGDSGEKIITVNVDARPGQTQDSVLQQALGIEDLLSELEVERYQTVITGPSDDFGAISQVLSGRGTNSATITVELHSGGQSKNDAAEELRGLIAGRISEADNISVTSEGGGFGDEGVAVTVAVEDAAGMSKLEEVTSQLTSDIAAIEDTTNIKNDLASAQRTISVTVDPQRALAAGLQTQDIAASLTNLSSVITVANVDFGEGSQPLRLRLSSTGTGTIAEIGSLEVASGVRLDSVASLEEVTKQVSITRVDGQLAATISGDITSEDVGSVSSEVQSAISNFDTPEGIDISVGGVGGNIDAGFADLFIAIGVSIVLVYVVMAVLFGSWIDPFVILFSLPLAIIGAIVALVVTDSTLSISALIGILMLVGIVVTNAIVMLEFVIMLRHERGYSLYDALMEGALTRLRPILMTAIAAMFALVPLSLGLTEGTLIASDLGRTVIGGLFSSTLLTLFVVPVVYSLVHDFKNSSAPERVLVTQDV